MAVKKPKEEPSIEDSVSAAWSEAEEGLEARREGGDESAAEVEVADEPEDESGQPRDEDGKFAKKDGEEEEAEGAEEPAEGDEGAEAVEGGEPAAGEVDPAAAAAAAAEGQPGAAAGEPAAVPGAAAAQKYASWRPAEREALLALKGPEAELVRAAAARREAQMTDYVRETEQVRRFANEFAARAEPYRPLYAMLNTTPVQAFDVLMRSAAVLYQGDARMKARFIAETIKERAVDVDMVADYLEGKTADGGAVPQSDPQIAQLTQAVQTLQGRLDQQGQADEQRAQELADRHVATWAKDKPWYPDVKKRMAMLVKAADEAGEPLTLDQAYATAISLDPEISKLETKRVAAEKIKKLKADAERARRAGRSPRPQPTAHGAHSGASGRGVEDDVAQAWEESEGRVA